ncbi:hypothetical protein QQZ08_005298 [Neonectria magnoliae]|uniref:Heterokaryon incompatibility domain-containing protein n=1 Tax=Neonectria magnoliae TaxID=2732573 RepID=A0ABR1I3W7_9HYPO
MRLTERLGYRYFYVDALCIPQNDETTKLHEIGQMAAIFSTAVATIVATDGDARDGIHGLYDISEPRNLKQTIYPFIRGESVIETDSWLNETCLQGDYASRGWTFQEYHMSKRRIIFSEGRVHWECACAIWREDQMPPVDSENSSRQTRESFSLPKILHGFPSTRDYQDFLVGYSFCRLTYEEDCLPAISGTLSLMARTFVGGFLCGIPEMYFDICIIWVSSDCQSTLRRPRGDTGDQDVNEGSGRSKAESLCPPTWSWVGWKGPFIHWGGTDEYIIQSHARWDYMPIVEWYTSESASGPWRRVESHWYDYVQGARDPEWQPPKGWTKALYEPSENNDDTDGPIKPPEGLGKFAFKHPSFPDTKFFCPFPLADSDQSPPRPDLVRSSPFLSCWAQRIHLAPSGRKGYEPEEAVFQDENGAVVGTLQPNNKEYWFALFDELESDPDSEESTASPSRSMEEDADPSDEPLQVAPKDPMALGVDEKGIAIELVAILHARRGTSSRFDETPVYFALWIEWEGNIAYRKGLAEISVEFWNLKDVEEIGLVLR